MYGTSVQNFNLTLKSTLNFYIAHSLPGLLHCEELQSKILHEDNLELARTRDTIAFSYVTEGK